MGLLDYLRDNDNLISNSKGGVYNRSSLNANLDLFAAVSRYQDEDEVIKKFNAAYQEDKKLALANLLLLLDVREGKGERRLFKICFKYLCKRDPEAAVEILKFIPMLGRWDYILEGLDTPIEQSVLNYIEQQLMIDLHYPDKMSLLAKWLPSHRTHGKTNLKAQKIYRYLKLSEKEYRKMLKMMRARLNLVENNLTHKEYNINFEHVPTKAMLKYRKAFERNCKEDFAEYLDNVKAGTQKINTKGLFCYEIINKIIKDKAMEQSGELFDAMWNNQRDFLQGNSSNVLVMADTSGSMESPNYLPISNSIGLAIYIAERNHGYFKDYFLTFSDEPRLQKIQGVDIVDKVAGINTIVANTDIDKAFKLILDAAEHEHLSEDDMPSHIIIISDMEFDHGCYSSGDPYDTGDDHRGGWGWYAPSKSVTNLDGWKKAFADKGYQLPKIIFWNVAASTNGLPATKQDNDVAMISGFSTYILENILNPENITPEQIMRDTLDKYIRMLDM